MSSAFKNKILEVISMKSKKINFAKLMETVARKSVEMSSESRCMYIYHQPKMPPELKKIKE
jgi:cyclic lactone autoinducer peptide